MVLNNADLERSTGNIARVPEPTVSASPGSLSETQNLIHYPDLLNPNLLFDKIPQVVLAVPCNYLEALKMLGPGVVAHACNPSTLGGPGE